MVSGKVCVPPHAERQTCPPGSGASRRTRADQPDRRKARSMHDVTTQTSCHGYPEDRKRDRARNVCMRGAGDRGGCTRRRPARLSAPGGCAGTMDAVGPAARAEPATTATPWGDASQRPIPPGSLTYSANPATYPRDVAITANWPSCSGGAVVFYSVSPSLPPGLSVDRDTGAITGTPTRVTATASYLVTASNSAGNATAWVSITVSEAGPGDAGSLDAGAYDAGPVDAGSLDAGPYDAGPSDAGSLDAGPYDAGPGDAGSRDAGGLRRRTRRCRSLVCVRWHGGDPDGGRVAGPPGQGDGRADLPRARFDGAAQATVVHFMAPAAKVAGTWHSLGRVLACRESGDVVEVTQDLDGQPAVARLSAPHSRGAPLRGHRLGRLCRPSGRRSPRSPRPTSTSTASARSSTRWTRPGRSCASCTFDNAGDKGDRSYKVAPWFVSTRGYGFHLDSSAESTFDMRAASGRYVVTNHVGTLRFNVVYGPDADRRAAPATPASPAGPCLRRRGRSGPGSPRTSGATGARSATSSRSSASAASPSRRSSSTRPGRSPTTTSPSTSRPEFRPAEPGTSSPRGHALDAERVRRRSPR